MFRQTTLNRFPLPKNWSSSSKRKKQTLEAAASFRSGEPQRPATDMWYFAVKWRHDEDRAFLVWKADVWHRKDGTHRDQCKLRCR